jgi:uncharacterized protein YjiS (DUF1127 family)
MNRTCETHAYQAFGKLPPQSLVVRLADAVLGWHERSRQRAQLAALDVRLRRDLGLSPADVARESEKPFWRP